MDYKNGRIYQILNSVDKDVYVGSTCQPLSKRMAKHRSYVNSKDRQHTPLYIKMKEYGLENFYIELLEEFPCENKEQLRRKEGQYIREIGTLNTCIAGRTQREYQVEHNNKKHEYDKQYRESNQDKIQTQHKQYREENPEKIKQYNQQYRESNQDKIKNYYEENKMQINAAKNVIITCECGCSHSKQMRARHSRSKAHTTWLNLQTESIEV